MLLTSHEKLKNAILSGQSLAGTAETRLFGLSGRAKMPNVQILHFPKLTSAFISHRRTCVDHYSTDKMESKGSRNNSRPTSGHAVKGIDLSNSEDGTFDAQAKTRPAGIADREGKLTFNRIPDVDSKSNLPLLAEGKYAADSFDLVEEKQRILEIQQELEAEEEFERLKEMPAVVKPCVAQSSHARLFVRGFQMYGYSSSHSFVTTSFDELLLLMTNDY